MGPFVFISYGRDDRSYVERLAAHLESAGIRVWYDHDLRPGQEWSRRIQEKIESCAAFIVVMTPAAASSRWVNREILHAEAERKTILPVLLRGSVFFGLNDLHYVDAVDGSMPGDDTIVRLRGLRGADGRRSPLAAHGPSFERAELGDLIEIGSGGQARVFRVELPPFGPDDPVVYKEYREDVLPLVDAQVLRDMVEVRALPAAFPFGDIEVRSAWPRAPVTGDGELTGFLMPAAPERFSRHIELPGGRRHVQARFQLLLNRASYLAARGLSLSDETRYLLLREAAEALRLFHRMGVVVGDLSPNNILFDTVGDLSIYFLDCDSMRFRGRSVLPQLETPNWGVGINEERATTASDVHKLGLLALRLFAGDQTTRDISTSPVHHDDLTELMRRSLSRQPAVRPGAAEWVDGVDAVLDTFSRGTIVPTYVVMDESATMARFTQVNASMAELLDDVLTDPMASGGMRVALLGLSDDVTVRMSMEDLSGLEALPAFQPRGEVSYRALIAHLLDRIPKDIETLKARGYRVVRPLVLFYTCGAHKEEPWKDLRSELAERPWAPDFVVFGTSREAAAAAADLASGAWMVQVAEHPRLVGGYILDRFRSLVTSVITRPKRDWMT